MRTSTDRAPCPASTSTSRRRALINRRLLTGALLLAAVPGVHGVLAAVERARAPLAASHGDAPRPVAAALRLTDIPRARVADSPRLDVGTGDFSLALWVQPISLAGQSNLIDKRAIRPGEVRGYQLSLADGRIVFQMADGLYRNTATSSVLTDGRWQHLAVSVDRDRPDGIRFFLDGVALPETGDPRPFSGSLSNSADLALGPASNEASQLRIDGLVLARRVLDPAEVSRLSTQGRPGDQVAIAESPPAHRGSAAPHSDR